jgi:VCBS repeat-containing protein
MFMAIMWLIEQGVDIITHSCGWVNIGPYDGTGGICESINIAHAGGIFWANSIGNQAERHWEGYFKDKDLDLWHEFKRRDETIDISASGGDTIFVFLSWNDWGPLWPDFSGGSTHDYDLYLLDAGLNIVAYSTNYQNGAADPIEGITYSVPASGIYHVVVHNYAASGDHHLEIYSFRHNLEHQVPESSLMIPADAAGAVAAGAAHWDSKSLEYFSSWGPPDIEGGGPPDYDYPVYKPELLSPDDVSTVTYSGGFLGTSASSPHIAGAAAILLSLNSPYFGSTPDQLRALFADNATNNGYGTLPDWIHGYGFLTMPTLGGNNPPVAVDDDYSMAENTTLDVPAPGVLSNDSDPDGDPLTAALASISPSHGTLSFFADGSFTYAPDQNFTGTDSFSYLANDSLADSNEATVTITITATSADTMHVESIDLSVKTKGPKYEAVAKVKIVDERGKPISGAEVFGTFSGDQIEASVSTSATTNKRGIASLKFKKQGQITSFTFCVDNATHSSYFYDPAANVENCDTY